MSKKHDREFASAPRNLDHLYRGSMAPRAPSATELGKRLAWLRREVGYSAADVARRCNVEEADVLAFERDGSGTAETLLSLITSFSSSWRLDEAFPTPRLDSVDDTVEFARSHP